MLFSCRRCHITTRYPTLGTTQGVQAAHVQLQPCTYTSLWDHGAWRVQLSPDQVLAAGHVCQMRLPQVHVHLCQGRPRALVSRHFRFA